MEEEMKCEKCGNIMKKIDDNTLKCEGCGTTKSIDKNGDEEAK